MAARAEGAKPPATAGRLAELDGLRAVAIVLVLLYHFMEAVPIAGVRRVTGFGWAGVDLFFVLSGYLIGGILLEKRKSPNYYRVFYLRRCLRILPLYVVVITPALLVAGLGLQSYFAGHSLGGQFGVAIWLYPVFLQNIGSALLLASPLYLAPAWSLAVEEQFYLLLPPMVRHFKPQQFAAIIVTAIFAAPTLRGALLMVFGAKAAVAGYVLLPCRWDALLLGVLSAYAIRVAELKEWMIARMGLLRIVWLTLAAGMVAMISAGLERLSPLVVVVGYTWNAVFFTCTLLLATLNDGGWFSQWLSRPWLKPVATVSYGMYLLQGPTLALVQSVVHHTAHAPTGWIATSVNFLAMAVTAIMAAASWRFFESRLIRLGHKYNYHAAEAAVIQAKYPANQM